VFDSCSIGMNTRHRALYSQKKEETGLLRYKCRCGSLLVSVAEAIPSCCHPLLQLSATGRSSHRIWSDELHKREKAEAGIRAVIRLLKRRAKGSETLFTIASLATSIA
jgi:hypothetical protein